MGLAFDKNGQNRVHTTVRFDSSPIKVPKALAEHGNASMADMIQTIAPYSFDNNLPFNEETLKTIERLKTVYECNLNTIECPCLNRQQQ